MIGKTISHYKILEKLGDGGMGEVYLAEDTNLKRKVALKFLPKEYSYDPEAKKRFMNEALSVSSLDHNNICIIHEISETDDGQLFISMNYCGGETLQNYIKEKDLTIKEILKIITQISKGLEKAHSKGIVHCDIKPSNIIITDDRVAKIVDFGIAKIASEEKLHSKERTSGTIAYMSPEQVSDSEVDVRTDIWSLGVVFYEMLTKRMPFQDSYNEALMYSIINEEPEEITKINSDISAQLEQIVNKLLKKDPDNRYQIINELLKDLKSYSRVVDIPINPIKYFKLFFADKKNKRLSLVASFLLSIFVFSIIYFTVIRGSSVPSIGILNMENLGDPEDEFWSRGITEDLIINVASAGIIRVPTLIVCLIYGVELLIQNPVKTFLLKNGLNQLKTQAQSPPYLLELYLII
jgi:serine/threonine protein kinase